MGFLPPVSTSLDEQAAALREGAGARELDDVVIALRGSDRLDWLSGIVTNDTKSLRPGQSRYVAIVHEKGKILADGWVLLRDDEVLLVVPSSTVEPLVEHFERHIIMEEVEVSVRRDLRVASVQGRLAATVLKPDGRDAFVADRIGWGGVDVVVDQGSAMRAADVTPVSDAAWEIARLEAGIARFGVDFGGENYVQEANITSRAVSFSKGCYVGQEVVCRLAMRGHVRRQLVSLVMAGEPPAAGTPVGQVGAVTSSARSAKLEQAVALAMLKWDVATHGVTVEVEGRPAQIVERPLAE